MYWKDGHIFLIPVVLQKNLQHDMLWFIIALQAFQNHCVLQINQVVEITLQSHWCWWFQLAGILEHRQREKQGNMYTIPPCGRSALFSCHGWLSCGGCTITSFLSITLPLPLLHGNGHCQNLLENTCTKILTLLTAACKINVPKGGFHTAMPQKNHFCFLKELFINHKCQPLCLRVKEIII